MKYTFIMTGRPKSDNLANLYKDYLNRLKNFGNVDLLLFPEIGFKKEPTPKQIELRLNEEAKTIIETLDKSAKIILIDLHGKDIDSIVFSKEIEKIKSSGTSHIYVIVGSSYGISNLLREKAYLTLKLSSLTFTHPLALLLAMEQVYRAEMISANKTYHK
ncbi:MAG: 23S rRNA (pseudouridine(1915)-N(3))-methyltransferase RlmH [Bacilli bacterium]|jgi:ribosomal RNA large subunit methyltransferase H|nr:ribosomal RNA large subunit methyltransferase H [Firmicutes bacterium CAG:345]